MERTHPGTGYPTIRRTIGRVIREAVIRAQMYLAGIAMIWGVLGGGPVMGAGNVDAGFRGGAAADGGRGEVRDTTRLRFVIRVDDILSRNTSILPRSIEPFQQVVEERGGVVTWGVMPHRFIEGPNLDGALAAELRASAERGHELSQHGYEHVCMVCGQSSHEMSCTSRNLVFDYDRQRGIVQRGLDLMAEKLGMRPRSFIPPGHIGNATTWEVLDDMGFPVLSTVMSSGPVTGGLINLPPLGEYTWALTEGNYKENLEGSLADIRERAATGGYYVLMMHDPFIRQGYGNGITLRWMGELLDSLNAEYGETVSYQRLSDVAEWLRDPSSVSVQEERPGTVAAEGFELMANVPNPFNPSTVIGFRLEAASRVRLSLHDVAGREVRVLLEGVRAAGSHRVEARLEDLPSGTYLYALQVDGRRKVRAMTLLK